MVGSKNVPSESTELGLEQDTDLIVGDGRLPVPTRTNHPSVRWIPVTAGPRRTRFAVNTELAIMHVWL